MNKYNVRAIRNDLDSCIRYNSWSKFRKIFQPLQPDLQQAVVREQVRRNKQTSSRSLLYTLCRCIKPSSHPPIDIIESVLQVSPPSLLSQSGNRTSTTTPLQIAIDRQAPPSVVEALLKYDKTKESLYQKGRGGDTPLLAAVRQRQRIVHFQQTSSDESIVSVLVRHDRRKQSLLIPSKTKQRVPLYYVANQEIAFLLSEEDDEKDGNEEINLDEELEYLLIQTYQAIEMQQGRLTPEDEHSWKQEESQEDTNAGGFFLNASSTSRSDTDSVAEGEGDERMTNRAQLLLRATLACAHLLGSKNSTKLLQYLFRNSENLNQLDEQGNSLLHHACRAQESDAFLEPCFVDEESSAKRNLLQHLITINPRALTLQNHNGETPLHVAIRCKKRWEFLRHLCPESFATTILQAQTNEGRLALHLAIENYPPDSNEIVQLWKGYPDASTAMDGKERLFAFQLVGAFSTLHQIQEPPSCSSKRPKEDSIKSCSSGKDETRKNDDMHDLDLAFFFLRAFPQVLQQHIR